MRGLEARAGDPVPEGNPSAFRETYHDMLEAAAGADLMVAGELNYAAPLVAEKLGLRWVSAILSPGILFLRTRPVRHGQCSLADPRAQGRLASLSRRFQSRPARNQALVGSRAPVAARRRTSNRIAIPVFRDKFSPELVLALFSPLLAHAQPDWPAQTLQPVLFSWTSDGSARTSIKAGRFSGCAGPSYRLYPGLDGSARTGRFLRGQRGSSQKTGAGGRLLLGTAARRHSIAGKSARCLTRLTHGFPRAAVNVHQADRAQPARPLRAGRPQLIVPFGWDQPDNAVRVERLGAGFICRAARIQSGPLYGGAGASAAGEAILRSVPLKSVQGMQAEDGLASACNAIEALLD